MLLWVMSTLAADPVPAASSGGRPDGRTAASEGVTDPILAAILEEEWQARMAASPLLATRLGDHRFDTRLDDPSPRARKRYVEKQRSFAERARRLTALTAEDAVTRDIFVRELGDSVAVDEACRFAEWSFSPRDNALTYAQDLGRTHAIHSAEDAGNLVARYQKLPGWIDAQIANLRLGLDDGLVSNRVSVEKVIAMVDTELSAAEADQGLLQAIRDEHSELSAAEAGAFDAGFRQSLRPVREALRRYRDFLQADILPKSRTEGREGLSALPIGEACYAARVRQETTTSRTPEQIHQQGLDELTRIHAEMVALGERTLGTRGLTDLFARLRSDPALHFSTRDEVLATAEAALRRAEAAAPTAFSRLPKAACVTKAIPDLEAPYTTIAYYWQAVPDGSAPGIYYVNTWEPHTRTRFDAEVLAFHESVPGHHFQIALAQELPGLPAFRNNAEYTVFIEGWALYTERLADEMGLYSGDLDRIGMLGFDTWRASRLVVDTGIHAMGWSRQEAEAFLLENTPLAPNNITNEVDRYINWPGQALAYKTGQMEILRMRAEAKSTLGARFTLPGFHEAILGGGAVPLDVLEGRVRAWVSAGR